jgi:4-diphosphocytidyl-2-C-methyl-D-erythritol kinase
MKFNRIKSFAKVNLSLNINGKLESKLHRIESLITFIHLHDVIYLKMIESNKHLIKFKGKFAKGIKKENTISKLLEILDNDNFLDGKKFLIKVEKNIPLQSGLGGGSMNASSILNYFIKKKLLKLKKMN